MTANDNAMLTGSKDKALFCADCGCADVTTSALGGGEAGCNVCGWKGRVEDLAVFHFEHGSGSTPDEVFQRFFLDLRKLLSLQFAQDVGRLLIQWGFLEAPDGKNKAVVAKQLARYIGGIAKAIFESVAKTRADIEKEQHAATPRA